MKDNFIKFRSITHALKAQNILKQLKIKSEIERISGHQSTQGCAYQLKFNANIQYIKNILIKNKIKFIS